MRIFCKTGALSRSLPLQQKQPAAAKGSVNGSIDAAGEGGALIISVIKRLIGLWLRTRARPWAAEPCLEAVKVNRLTHFNPASFAAPMQNFLW